MNLQKVTGPQFGYRLYGNNQRNTGQLYLVKCYGCKGELLRNATRDIWADLDGPPFKAYYCGNCAWKLQNGYKTQESSGD